MALSFNGDLNNLPDSIVNRANKGLIWVLSAPDGPHVGSMKLAIRAYIDIVISRLCFA